MSYDKNNIFAKILRGEIPCDKVYENDHVLAFKDINPLKKVHVLVIPKGEYVDLDDFNNNASDKEIVELNKAVSVAYNFAIPACRSDLFPLSYAIAACSVSNLDASNLVAISANLIWIDW